MERRKKEKKMITVEEITPFVNGKRTLNNLLGSSCFLISIGDEKIVFGVGAGCLTSLIGKIDVRDIGIFLIPDSSPELSGDLFGLLHYIWKIQKNNGARGSYLFGYEKLNSYLKLLTEIFLGKNSNNDFGITDFTGIIQHGFSSKDIIIETFPLEDGSSVGFIIKAYGKKISLIPSFSFSDIAMHEKIKNSNSLIISECKLASEDVSKFRDIKRALHVSNVITSFKEPAETVCKYGTVNFCNENAFKIAEMVDAPSLSKPQKSFFENEFFVKIEPKNFLLEDHYIIPDRVGSTGIKDFNKKRILFIDSSGQFKDRFAGKEEKINNSEMIIGNLKGAKTLDELHAKIKPIRFLDLMFLLSNDLVSKEVPSGFFLLDKFNNPQMILLYPLPGQWEICDNVTEEDLLCDIKFIGTV